MIPTTGKVARIFEGWRRLPAVVLDTRTFRDDTSAVPAGVAPQMLGDKQTAWLIDALKSSKATFKILPSGSKFSP